MPLLPAPLPGAPNPRLVASLNRSTDWVRHINFIELISEHSSKLAVNRCRKLFHLRRDLDCRSISSHALLSSESNCAASRFFEEYPMGRRGFAATTSLTFVFSFDSDVS
jgi:hypothetical protein